MTTAHASFRPGNLPDSHFAVLSRMHPLSRVSVAVYYPSVSLQSAPFLVCTAVRYARVIRVQTYVSKNGTVVCQCEIPGTGGAVQVCRQLRAVLHSALFHRCASSLP